MSPIYTKSFGGKIWKNLHSVSPDNFLDKKFKIGSLIICRQKNIWTSPRAKKLKVKRQLVSRWQKKKYEKATSTFCNEESLPGEYLSFSNSFARDDVSDKTFFRPIYICNTGHIKKKVNFFLPKQTVTVKVLKYCGES